MLTEAVLLEQNKRLREENDELRETVRQLRQRPATASLPPGLPYFTYFEELIIRALLGADGRVVSSEMLYRALYGVETDREAQVVHVMICRLRKKLRGTPYSIVTTKSRGYHIERATEALAA